jgi:hypothetical protein
MIGGAHIKQVTFARITDVVDEVQNSPIIHGNLRL